MSRTKAEIDAIVATSPTVESHRHLAQFFPKQHSPEAAFGSTLDWLMRRGVGVREIAQVWEGTKSGADVHNKIWARYPEEKLTELARILGIKEKITGDAIYNYMKKYLEENPWENDKAVAQFKERMKEDPALSFEYATHALLEIFMAEGLYLIEEMRAAFGDSSAIQIWCKVWARWHEHVYDALVKELGIKGDVGIPEIAKITQRCLQDFGNPITLVYVSSEKAILRCPRCPYSELKFKMFSPLQANEQCDFAMIPCNEAQLLSYAEKAGKRGQIIAKHNRQLCQGDESCEWSLEIVGYDRSKTYFDFMKAGLKEYEAQFRRR